MNFEEMSEQEILDIANPIMDNLMEASTEINHEKHIKDYTERLRNITTKEHLERVCQKYQSEKGYFSERKVISVFRRPESAAIIWKQFFTKDKGEYVAEMVLVHQNGKFLCDHAFVF